MKRFNKLFDLIIEPENLFSAWDEFKKGKGKKPDVLRFEKNLEQNIFQLSRDLRNGIYEHGGYTSFYIRDPKLRHIHKARVVDRVLHHAVFKILNPIFEPTYIHNSFSCRIGKGNHKGVETLAHMLRQASENNTKTCYVLKCDIKKFFDSIDHQIFTNILSRKIKDEKTTELLGEVISSYSTTYERERERERESTFTSKKGVPIGNLTSQLFANVYMNEFDQFIKHSLKIKYYARYTDDFVIVSDSEEYLKQLLDPIQGFLKDKLKLELHSNKVSIRKYHHGIDFLGYVILPNYIKLRTKTQKRMFHKLKDKILECKNGVIEKFSLGASFQSYLGVLSHADAYNLTLKLKNDFWFRLRE